MSNSKKDPRPRAHCLRCELDFWAILPGTKRKRRQCPFCKRREIHQGELPAWTGRKVDGRKSYREMPDT